MTLFGEFVVELGTVVVVPAGLPVAGAVVPFGNELGAVPSVPFGVIVVLLVPLGTALGPGTGVPLGVIVVSVGVVEFGGLTKVPEPVLPLGTALGPGVGVPLGIIVVPVGVAPLPVSCVELAGVFVV